MLITLTAANDWVDTVKTTVFTQLLIFMTVNFLS